MWKLVALVLALFVLGHFVVRYLRVNPLGPVVEGSQVVVTSQELELRYRRSGPVAGTYFVSAAESRDFGAEPVNAMLWVIEAEAARGYMRDYPDFHLYGSDAGERMSGVAAPLAVVAASSATYSGLVRLLDQHEARSGGHGERLCVRIGGTALSPDSAIALDSGRDDPSAGQRLLGRTPVVFVDALEIEDCVKALALPQSR